MLRPFLFCRETLRVKRSSLVLVRWVLGVGLMNLARWPDGRMTN